MATAQSILNSTFFNTFASLYGSSDTDLAHFPNFVINYKDEIAAYVVLNYGKLKFWDELDDMTVNEIASMAYVIIGANIEKIWNSLITQYNPLENYFVDRTMNTTTNGDITKSGNKETTPSGAMNVKSSGSRTKQYNNHGTLHKGTTFESTTQRPISEDIAEGSVTDNFNNYGTETSYSNYKTTETFNNLKDTTDMEESVTEHRAGNSGIFRKQELTTAEIDLRVKSQAMKIFVRLLIDLFNTGVYENGT